MMKNKASIWQHVTQRIVVIPQDSRPQRNKVLHSEQLHLG